MNLIPSRRCNSVCPFLSYSAHAQQTLMWKNTHLVALLGSRPLKRATAVASHGEILNFERRIRVRGTNYH